MQVCLSYLLLPDKWPQTRQLKTTHFYYLAVPVGQGPSLPLLHSLA